MVLFNSIEEVRISENTCVALGNFDGIHVGHKRIIEETAAAARIAGMKSAVLTFSTHTKNMVEGMKPVKSIITQEEKVRLIEGLGVDYLVNVPFTKEILRTEAKAFIEDILLKVMRMKRVFCGFNYRFGHRAMGNGALLREEGERKGFKVNIMDPVTVDGDVVSSTLIRGLIKSGEVDECKKFLGRDFSIEGTVVFGNQLGRTIGFPTLNINIMDGMVTPPNGVYITRCIYEGRAYPAVTNIGIKPTVGDYAVNAETHVFDFDRDLYGETVRVEFLKKTRDEVKFANVRQLSEQIGRDCEAARRFHGI